jgi:hypothetical protein
MPHPTYLDNLVANNSGVAVHTRTRHWACRDLGLQAAVVLGASPASRSGHLHDVCGGGNDPGVRISMGTQPDACCLV